MDHRCEFTEEMFRELYQRRGYQVYRLCREASADRNQAMEMTFQTFADAHRQLSFSSRELTAEYQDDVLLECTRAALRRAAPAPQPVPAAPEVLQEEEACLPEELSPQDLPDPLPEAPAGEPCAEPVPEEAPEEAAEACAEPVPEEPAGEAAPVLELLTPIEPTDEPLLPVEETPAPVEEALPEAPAEEAVPVQTSGIGLGWFLLVFFLVLLIFILLWAIWGVAQNIFPLPYYDLGYQWFNQNVYPLF